LPTDAITGSMLPNVNVRKKVEGLLFRPTTCRRPMLWRGNAGHRAQSGISPCCA